jgi:hypothetical protein
MISINLTYETNKKTLLIDLNSLLYDYQLLYDFYVLSLIDDYQSYSFGSNFWYRTGRPLYEEDKLQLYGIHYGSALTVITAATSYIVVRVIQPLVEISGQIADWEPNRRKAKAEALAAELKSIEKIADIEYKMIRNRRAERLLEATNYEVERKRIGLDQDRIRLDREQRKQQIQSHLEQRLSRNPYRLEDITVKLENKEKTE